MGGSSSTVPQEKKSAVLRLKTGLPDSLDHARSKTKRDTPVAKTDIAKINQTVPERRKERLLNNLTGIWLGSRESVLCLVDKASLGLSGSEQFLNIIKH